MTVESHGDWVWYRQKKTYHCITFFKDTQKKQNTPPITVKTIENNTIKKYYSYFNKNKWLCNVDSVLMVMMIMYS